MLLTEGFDDITSLPGAGWVLTNQSSPIGVISWFQGNSSVFPAQAGNPTAYIAANFNNTNGTGTISNWLITPPLNLGHIGKITFWTRTVAGSSYPDRLEVRLSTSGTSSDTGSLATDVGEFTTLLLEINPSLAQGGYPVEWTLFEVDTINASAMGRIAFRYFVTNGGPTGTNSDYIGIDTVEVTYKFPWNLYLPAIVTNGNP
ncbi:MAG: choice-of-anchor J domain-containing protein [Desulfobulbaceae bacterium]